HQTAPPLNTGFALRIPNRTMRGRPAWSDHAAVTVIVAVREFARFGRSGRTVHVTMMPLLACRVVYSPSSATASPSLPKSFSPTSTTPSLSRSAVKRVIGRHPKPLNPGLSQRHSLELPGAHCDAILGQRKHADRAEQATKAPPLR